MRSGEREGGAAPRHLLPAHWLWWGQEQSWTLFCTIYQPLLLPKELNCIEKHRALIRAGQLGRKIYHPNYQPAKTSRRDGEGGWVSRWGCSGEGLQGCHEGTPRTPCPVPTHLQWKWEVGCPSLSLGDFEDLFGFPKEPGGFDLVGGRFSPPEGRGGRLGAVGALESGLWGGFPP